MGLEAVPPMQGDGEDEDEKDSSETTGDGGVGMQGGPQRRQRKGRHYDSRDDVILRLEALQPKEVKVRILTNLCCCGHLLSQHREHAYKATRAAPDCAGCSSQGVLNCALAVLQCFVLLAIQCW